MPDPLHPSQAEENEAAGGPAQPANKEARDTVGGCRERAVQDRLQAEQATTPNGRLVLERSAASWERRADGIQDVADCSAAQRSADRAMWDSEDVPLPRR
jgi:hypothetical protein